MLGLHCCARAFSSCSKRVIRLDSLVVMCGLLFIVVDGLLNAVASLVVEHGLSSWGMGIFPDEGSNLCSWHWQEDSLFTVPPGKSLFPYLKMQNTIVYEENERNIYESRVVLRVPYSWAQFAGLCPWLWAAHCEGRVPEATRRPLPESWWRATAELKAARSPQTETEVSGMTMWFT